MEHSNPKNYQTVILFFSWTVALIFIVVRLFVKIEDPVRYALLLCLFDIALNLRRKDLRFNKNSYRILALIVIFYCWLIFSNAYSPSMSYKFDKSMFFLANLIFFIYPFFIKKINFNLLIWLYCLIVLPLSAYFVYMNSIVWTVNSAQTQMFMGIRDSYLVFGLHLGILFLLLLFHKKNIFLKLITFGLLIASGARGPLLFMLLVVGLYYSRQKLNILNPKNVARAIVVFIGLFVVYFFNAEKINSLLGLTFRRFGSLVEGQDASALERVYRLKYAFYQPFESLATFLFGNGIGSFGILYDKVDHRSYPHNILVECFFELGLIGLSILIALFIAVFRRLSLRENAFGLLFIFAFLNAMKSSNITDLWILFSFMGGIISMKAYYKEEARLVSE